MRRVRVHGHATLRSVFAVFLGSWFFPFLFARAKTQRRPCAMHPCIREHAPRLSFPILSVYVLVSLSHAPRAASPAPLSLGTLTHPHVSALTRRRPCSHEQWCVTRMLWHHFLIFFRIVSLLGAPVRNAKKIQVCTCRMCLSVCLHVPACACLSVCMSFFSVRVVMVRMLPCHVPSHIQVERHSCVCVCNFGWRDPLAD